MAFQPAPNVVRAVLHWNSTDMFWSNTLHFFRQGVTEEDMSDLGTALGSGLLQGLLGSLPEAVNCTGITLYDLSAADAPRVITTFDPALHGDMVGAEVSNISGAAVITFYANGRGKSRQGRIYIAGIAEGDADEQRVQSDEMEDFRAAMATLITSPPAGFVWSILSKQTNKALRAEGVSYPVTSVVARSGIWGSQNRRIKRP